MEFWLETGLETATMESWPNSRFAMVTVQTLFYVCTKFQNLPMYSFMGCHRLGSTRIHVHNRFLRHLVPNNKEIHRNIAIGGSTPKREIYVDISDAEFFF